MPIPSNRKLYISWSVSKLHTIPSKKPRTATPSETFEGEQTSKHARNSPKKDPIPAPKLRRARSELL